MELMKAKEFCDLWLPSWTGGADSVSTLLSFYSDDTFYLDPVMVEGVHGKEKLSDYFTKLLAKNPNWQWSAVEIMPTAKGFTLKSQAVFPTKDSQVTLLGLDIVEMEDDQITRNEVYFDRTPLLI